MLRVRRVASSVARVALLLCIGPLATGAEQSDSLAGDWIGRLELASRPAFLRIAVDGTAREGWAANVVLQPITAISPINAEARPVLDSWRDASVTVDGMSWTVAAGTPPNEAMGMKLKGLFWG